MSQSAPTKFITKISDRTYVGLVMGLAAAIRLVGLGHSSIWHDEGFTVMMAQLPPAEIIHHTAQDVHPPLYYLIMHHWMQAFGSGAIALRSFSLVCILALIPLVFLLMRRWFGASVARLSLWFVALSPFLVHFSQEARMYGLMAFLAVLSTYLLVRAHDRGGWWRWLAYALTMTAGLYTYYYMVFVLLGHWVYLLFVSIYPDRSWRRDLMAPPWLVANALIACLFLPWLPTIYHQFVTIGSGTWLQPVNGDSLPKLLISFFTYTDMGQLPAAFLRTILAVMFAVGLGWFLSRTWRRHAHGWIMLVTVGVFVPVAIWAVSFWRPLFLDRYFTFAAIALYCLMAVMLIEGWPGRQRKVALGVVAALISVVMLVGDGIVYAVWSHQMRQLAAAVEQQYRPGDALINSNFYTFFDYRYYDHTGTPNQAYVPGNFPGCCEARSLLVDRPDLVIRNLATVHPTSGYAWLIARAAHPEEFVAPSNWQPIGTALIYGNLQAQRYRVE